MILELIHQMESQKKIEEAALNYEEWLSDHPDDSSSFIDLAFLYWCATDFGALSSLTLSADFVKNAAVRSRELLDKCIDKNNDPEAIFWRMYFDYMDWDRDITEDVKQLILAHPDCLIPHFLLVMNGIESPVSDIVSKLRKQIENSGHTKANYIRSVLDSCVISH